MNLKIKNLSKFYGEEENRVQVLKDISCEIKEGEIVVLLGPSGSGKSTLLNIIGGIETIDEGEVTVGNINLSNSSQANISKYRRENLGFVFQFYNLIPNLTAKENIEVCGYLSKDIIDINYLIETLGLKEHQNKFPNQLSGGQQQRTAIGRALIKKPGVILCDEPTGALDYKTSKEILTLIEQINEEFNNTIIIVTHNTAIKDMADHIINLKDGQIVDDYLNKNRKNAKDLEW